MARVKINQKFPCGYELEMDIRTFSQIDFDGYKIGICPLHGDKCIKLKGDKE